MAQQTALNRALEALTLAAECGGELDHEIYVEAHQNLAAVISAVAAIDATLSAADRVPEGDDYSKLLAILNASS